MEDNQKRKDPEPEPYWLDDERFRGNPLEEYMLPPYKEVVWEFEKEIR